MVDFLETDLPKQTAALAFVYCNHKYAQLQTIQYFIGAIVRQLAERNPDIPEVLHALYKKHQAKETDPTLSECFQLLRSLCKDISEVYIVIDALDECMDRSGQHIWSKLIVDLRVSIPNLRLLYTSRNLHDTTGALENSTVVPIRANKSDIRTYIKGQLQSQSGLLQFCQQDPSLEAEILETIVLKSDGM